MSDGELLPAVALVYRVLRPIHVAPTGVPFHSAFVPSSADEAHARARGRPVRVSVWDGRRVEADEAADLREVTDPVMVFGLFVSEVVETGEKFGAIQRVVHDPDGAPDQTNELMRAAHAGIEGLERRPGEARTAYRARLQALADRAALMPL